MDTLILIVTLNLKLTDERHYYSKVFEKMHESDNHLILVSFQS